MSCFKIFFIFIKILFVFSLNKAIAKEPSEVVVAKVNNFVIKQNLKDQHPTLVFFFVRFLTYLTHFLFFFA